MKHSSLVTGLVLLVGVGACAFWFAARFRNGSELDVQSQIPPTVVVNDTTNQPRMVSSEDLASDQLFKALYAPPPPHFSPVTNQYIGAPAVQPFIHKTMLEQLNRMNSVFNFLADTNGQPKPLSLDDIAYSATTMTGTFKFCIQSRPDFRFVLCFDRGAFTLFRDMAFDSAVFDRNEWKYEALRRSTNYLDKDGAIALAERTFLQLGYTRDQLRQLGQPYVRHLAVTHQGKQQLLPYFFIDYKGPKSDGDAQPILLSAEVLGIEPRGRITHMHDSLRQLTPIAVPSDYKEAVQSYWRSQGKPPPRY